MKINWLKSFKIAAILCSFAAIGGVSVALVNVFTEPMIAANKAEKEAKGLKKVFGESSLIDTKEGKVEINDPDYKYLSCYWEVDHGSTGRIYSVSGTNSYGSVSLLVGLTPSYSLYNVVVMENTESYATTLTDNYLNPLIGSTDKDEKLDSVKCGATYGAKLVRDMVNQAKEHYGKEKGDG